MNINKYGLSYSELNDKIIIQMKIEDYNYDITFDSKEEFKQLSKKEFENFNEQDFFKFYKDED